MVRSQIVQGVAEMYLEQIGREPSVQEIDYGAVLKTLVCLDEAVIVGDKVLVLVPVGSGGCLTWAVRKVI